MFIWAVGPHSASDVGRKNRNRMTVVGKTVLGKKLGPKRTLSGEGVRNDHSRAELWASGGGPTEVWAPGGGLAALRYHVAVQ
ncbi:hypothetical protein MA16_Dca012854 [Dendrobium catenatum]|uniref:Uncharacterized protein n=1 Tax=Dendrobium catenatum TaxID=906689 RepID=A0A2I0VXQ0_9ASPA|nr:hypothetical protein MA16_Dca012854 [Dendrobium catenatum]